MAERKHETRPLSPQKGADLIRDAGRISGLAQIAILSHADEIAASQTLRLRREALRLAHKYGAGSPEAIRADARAEQHKSYRRALVRELDRASVPVPAADPEAARLYGRVFAADGKPLASIAVQAVDSSGEKVVGRAKTDKQGAWLMTVVVKEPQDVVLRALASQKEAAGARTDPIRIAKGSRVFRDLRMPASRTPPKPRPPGEDTPPKIRKMPKLIGLSEADARAVLTRLGAASVKVTTESPAGVPSGTVLDQSPEEGTPLTRSTKYGLVVSARAPIKLPDLKKMTLREATVALNQLGLKIGDVSGDRKGGRVTEQTPQAGDEVTPGTVIDIKLGKGG
jgi:hypothetical protein